MLSKNKIILAILVVVFTVTGTAWAGNKKIMSTRAARVLAERAIVESVYGLKIRSSEEVIDMIAASFVGKTESKTAADIQGIKIDEVIYDAEKDIAQATASISLDEITNIDGQVLSLKGKTFKRVGFATSTPANAGPIKALRAAELDGYKNLVKTVVGFTLESQTTVENYMLSSDVVKVKVMATTYLADLVDYGWDQEGNAYVKFKVNVKDIEELLGAKIPGATDFVEVEGHGAAIDDFSTAQKKVTNDEGGAPAPNKQL
ncbi:MAG: hypothetical protein OEL83_15430 [Desulforhopalus sp.]|nr:hypothetical protein [Desulforhopalus sp.]